MARRPRPTEMERAQRRQADLDRLDDAVRQLLTSDGWQRWIRVRATGTLRRYSLRNQLLIALQRPDASYVAGYRAFTRLGRQVRRGEQALYVLAPVTRRDRDDTSADEDATSERKVVGFRGAAVFDVTQTDPIPDVDPVDLAPPVQCADIDGDSHAQLLDQLVVHAATLGYSVRFRAIEGDAGGCCDHAAREIVVNTDRAPNGRLRVLIHELAHAHGLQQATLGRGRAEVLVETVTYIVCAGIGLPTDTSSIPYIAGWADDEQGLDAIREYAQAIDTIARTLENAAADLATRAGYQV